MATAIDETQELVKLEVLNAVQVFTGGGMNAILDKIEATVRAIHLDVSTPAGRDEIRSVAYRVVRTKTALDAEGKKLTEEWRKNTTLVNAERKKSIERLEALAEEVRRPLTEFESKDKIRVAAHEQALAEMSELLDMMNGSRDGATAKFFETVLVGFSERHKDRNWEEFADRANKLRREGCVALIGKIESLKKYEADQAELARLRQEEVDRKQRERDERLKAEAAEAARIEEQRKAAEAADVERRRVEALAEQARLENERIRREAEDRVARAEADRRAAEENAEANRIRKEGMRLAAEQQARDAEAARIAAEQKAEADRIAAAKKADEDAAAAKRKAAADLKAAREKAARDQEAALQSERDRITAENVAAAVERRRREEDEANKARIRGEILEDLAGFLLPAGDAEKIADAIMAGEVRNVRVVF